MKHPLLLQVELVHIVPQCKIAEEAVLHMVDDLPDVLTFFFSFSSSTSSSSPAW